MRGYFRWAAAAERGDAGAVPASQGSATPLARLICISVVGPATPSGVRPCACWNAATRERKAASNGVVGRRRRGALLCGKLRAHGIDERAARAHRQGHRIAAGHAPEGGEVAAPGAGQQRERHLHRRLAHQQRDFVMAQAGDHGVHRAGPARRAARARSGARAGAGARGRRGRGSSARPARRPARTGRRRSAAATTAARAPAAPPARRAGHGRAGCPVRRRCGCGAAAVALDAAAGRAAGAEADARG